MTLSPRLTPPGAQPAMAAVCAIVVRAVINVEAELVLYSSGSSECAEKRHAGLREKYCWNMKRGKEGRVGGREGLLAGERGRGSKGGAGEETRLPVCVEF